MLDLAVRKSDQNTYRNTYRWIPSQLSPIELSYRPYWAYQLKNRCTNFDWNGSTFALPGVSNQVIEKKGIGPNNESAKQMAVPRFEYYPLDKLVYSVSEAAKILSVSRQTVYNWIREGRLVPIYLTSRAQISAEVLVRFVQSEQHAADEAQRSKHWSVQ